MSKSPYDKDTPGGYTPEQFERMLANAKRVRKSRGEWRVDWGRNAEKVLTLTEAERASLERLRLERIKARREERDGE